MLRFIPAIPMAFTVMLVAFGPAFGETEDEPGASVTWATLRVEPDVPARLQVVSRTRDPAITAALTRMARRPPQVSDFGGDWTQWEVLLPIPTRRGLVLREDFALDPLLEVLRDRGVPALSLLIQHPPAGFVELAGATGSSIDRGSLSVTLTTRRPRTPLAVELGWRPIDVTSTAAALLLALVVPIVAGLVIWRRSVAHDRDPEKWFFRVQSMQIAALGGWTLWMGVVEATRVADLIDFAPWARGWPRMLAAAIWWLGLLPTTLALGGITRRMVRRLRGFDPLAQGLSGRLRVLGLLAFILLAGAAFAAENIALGVLALLTFIVCVILLPGPRGPFGTTPQSLSSGILRDRLFDLAHRAGVRVRELYVVPMRRQRMANAFAVQGGMVMVADELLDRMSRREVDAVLAHEVSHLEHHHPILMLLVAVGVSSTLVTVAIVFRIPYGLAAVPFAAWITHHFAARRFELVADAGSVALTDDAEALISGLGRLARVNDMPLSWGRAWAWLITHPTTTARGMAIGRRAGIPSARVTELLETGLDPDQRYGDRERPGEQERVFSTAWKAATLGRLGFGSLVAAALAPAGALAIMKTFGLQLPTFAVIPGGSVLALLAILVVYDRFAARIVSGLEPAIRRRFAAGESDSHDGFEQFVVLSPGDRAHVYEGFLDWDIGLLAILPDHLRYRGEQITLQLPRTAIHSIEIGAVAPGWIRTQRVIVRWTVPTGEESIMLRAADCRTVSGIAPGSQALASRLKSWRGDPAARGSCNGPSGIGPVTGLTAAQAAGLRALPATAFVLGVLSAAASIALGLGPLLGLESFVAAFIGVIAMRWPAMTSREPKAAESTSPKAGHRAA